LGRRDLKSKKSFEATVHSPGGGIGVVLDEKKKTVLESSELLIDMKHRLMTNIARKTPKRKGEENESIRKGKKEK